MKKTFYIFLLSSVCCFSQQSVPFSYWKNPLSLPLNIKLSSIEPYFIVSVNDNNYLPYTVPTDAASLITPNSPDGITETKTLNIQGILTKTGVTIKIPYTVVTASVSLPAYSKSITIPSSYTEDGNSRVITFSYPAANTIAVGTGTIDATLKAVGNDLNVKKLDMQNGIGNDVLGFLLGQFSYYTDSFGNSANFQVRAITPIPDRNINDANHRMLYAPILGEDGRNWLNNNLGADYANTDKASFNPIQRATADNDYKGFGSLFQGGRYSDGHELVTWTNPGVTFVNTTTTTKSVDDTPDSPLFITTGGNDWRTSVNSNLWQDESGTNNPCPHGFRLPVINDYKNLIDSASITDRLSAGKSILRFSFPGYRESLDGKLTLLTNAFYWTSDIIDNKENLRLFMSEFSVKYTQYNRGCGYSVRCIKD